MDGDAEAHLIALSCSEPPEGRGRWTLQLLADKAVELQFVKTISRHSKAHTKKNELKPWTKIGWVIPPEANAEFVAAMENVLDVYRRPCDPMHPVVCMDETPRQLIGHTRVALPLRPGKPAREDYEYKRLGVCNVFMTSEPLAGSAANQSD